MPEIIDDLTYGFVCTAAFDVAKRNYSLKILHWREIIAGYPLREQAKKRGGLLMRPAPIFYPDRQESDQNETIASKPKVRGALKLA